jgi:hypothetical protein
MPTCAGKCNICRFSVGRGAAPVKLLNVLIDKKDGKSMSQWIAWHPGVTMVSVLMLFFLVALPELQVLFRCTQEGRLPGIRSMRDV